MSLLSVDVAVTVFAAEGLPEDRAILTSASLSVTVFQTWFAESYAALRALRPSPEPAGRV